MSNVERDHRFDLMRVIAMSMIVLMHSPIPGSAPGVIMSGISYVTEPGVGLFFMISGALLLNNNLSTELFLKRRLMKIMLPTLFWTLFYLVIRVVETPLTLHESVRALLSIPFSTQGHGVFWFIYTLIGLYLLTPILSKWLKYVTKREVELYLCLWVLTLIYPYLGKVLEINESTTGILYYFAGYVGYYVLGYYLKHFYCYRRYHVFLALLVSICIPLVLCIGYSGFDYYSMLWYLSIPIAAMSFCLYVLFLRMPNRHHSFISEVSRLSFGVYLIHIFIMRSILWKLDIICGLPGLIQIPVIFVLTFILSLILSWLISRLPFSRYIIGV